MRLLPLGEPPWFPAVFMGVSDVEDPRKKDLEDVFDFQPEHEKCWLLMPGGSEHIGTVSGELAGELEVGQVVFLTKGYVVIQPVPEDEISNLFSVSEASVTEVLDDGIILVSDSSEHTTRAAAVSDRVREELEKKPLKAGDRVLLFAGCILQILEREKPESVKEIGKVIFSDIGGLEKHIQEIRDATAVEFDPEACQAVRYPMAKGVLLYGPPRCGKTLLAKALANWLGRYYEVISGPDIIDKYVGVGPRTMRGIWKRLKENAPSIWIIDEADALLTRRGGSEQDTYKANYVTQFNALVDGVEDSSEIMVILITNRQDLIDSAVIGPGRIDVPIEIPRPDKDGARHILQIHFKDRAIAEPGNPREAVNNFVESIVSDLWSVKSSHKLFTIRRGSKREPFYFKHLVSGALLKNIINKSALRCLKRMDAEGIQLNDPAYGITKADLDGVVEDIVMREAKKIPTQHQALNQWLLTNGYSSGDTFRSGEIKVEEMD